MKRKIEIFNPYPKNRFIKKLLVALLFSIPIFCYGQRTNPYWERGIIKENSGDCRGAIQEYNKSIEVNPEDEYVYNRRGDAKAKLQDYRGAIQDYSKAIELNTKHPSGYKLCTLL